MKKIICPHDWDCGYENDIEDFSQEERLRINRAVENSSLLFVDCTKCERKFAFHTSEWRTENSHCVNPNKKNTENKKRQLKT